MKTIILATLCAMLAIQSRAQAKYLQQAPQQKYVVYGGKIPFSGTLEIPSSIAGTNITWIGDLGQNLAGVTNVIVPATVTVLQMDAFYALTNLQSIYFMGDPPPQWSDAFLWGPQNPMTFYYLPGNTNWGTTYALTDTAPWTPTVTINKDGVVTATYARGQAVIIEASTDLISWAPVYTNTIPQSDLITNALPGPSISFTDTDASKYQNRFYRVTSPTQ